MPASWLAHGGVMLPMYQSEALWLNFTSDFGYPFGVKVGTGKVTAEEYTRSGLPWSSYYEADRVALEGAPLLEKLKSVKQMGAEKGDAPLPENTPVDPAKVIALRSGLAPDEVREGTF